jgi:signal transduction histidine kinase
MTVMEDLDHLSDVVKALLHLSQAESGQLVLAREPVALGSLVEKVIEQFQLPADAEQIQLDCRTQRGLVTGDRVQLQRLISNLISNALKFTPSGGRVSVEVTARGEFVDLIVADTGCGISQEHLPHIYERFYRVPDSGRPGERGLGLGLSFVNWIAKEHNARILVDSRVGEGTTFTIRFPVRQHQDQPDELVPAREGRL